jgi:hypothetical protein
MSPVQSSYAPYAVLLLLLQADLTAMNLWNPALKNELVAANGSVQGLNIPMHLKQLYKTVWEIKQRVLVDMAADRGAYIDQSQSFNVHMSDPNFGKLTSLHFHTWRKVGACCSVQFNALDGSSTLCDALCQQRAISQCPFPSQQHVRTGPLASDIAAGCLMLWPVLYCKAMLTDVLCVLCAMSAAAGPEDRHVLPAHARCCRCHQVHG